MIKIIKKAIGIIQCMLLITMLVCINENETYAENSIDENMSLDSELSDKIEEYIVENYEDGAENIDTIEETELYNSADQNGDFKMAYESQQLTEETISEIKEITMYLEIKEDTLDNNERYTVFNEDEFNKYIEENDVELDSENEIEDCSWKGEETYVKDSSDGYLKLVFTSFRDSKDLEAYTMYMCFYWLKQPYFAECDNYLVFGHDSNMTVDNDSIHFYFYHYKKINFSGEVSEKRVSYDISDSQVKTSMNGIKVRFSIGPSVGVIQATERRNGYLKFKARFANKYNTSSQLSFMYLQPVVSISGIWSNAISIGSGGSISVDVGTYGSTYKFSNEFIRK